MSAEGFAEFVAVVDQGSVTAAAASLELPRPTVSRRLAKLEERLGVRLLHRTTRKITLTGAGELLYARARRIVVATRDAEAEVRRIDDVPRGLLRVSTPTGPESGRFAELLADFMRLYPEVELEVIGSNAHVDLVAEGIDVAFRGGTVRDPSLIARKITSTEIIAVASPEYLAQHGTPRDPQELSAHQCIIGYEAGIKPDREWPLLKGGWIHVTGRLVTNQMVLRVQAAKRGLGIALAVRRMVSGDLEAGSLVHVLPEQVGETTNFSVVYADRQLMEPKVRAFVDHVTPRLLALLDAPLADAGR